MAIPDGDEDWKKSIFRLAQKLRAISPEPDEDLQQRAVIEWSKRASVPFDEAWAEFEIAWSLIDYPAIFEAAKAKAGCIDTPEFASGRSVKLQMLVRLCCVLQEHRGSKPFFLSCREAGSFVGTDPNGASRMFKVLVLRGVLKEVRKGSMKRENGRMQATQWLYLG